jgi:hypothetical protein
MRLGLGSISWHIAFDTQDSVIALIISINCGSQNSRRKGPKVDRIELTRYIFERNLASSLALLLRSAFAYPNGETSVRALPEVRGQYKGLEACYDAPRQVTRILKQPQAQAPLLGCSAGCGVRVLMLRRGQCLWRGPIRTFALPWHPGESPSRCTGPGRCPPLLGAGSGPCAA